MSDLARSLWRIEEVIMSLKRMNAIVLDELRRVPRGLRGSLQNLYRAVYWSYRMNSLGRRPQVFSATEAHTKALQLIRSIDADFMPHILSTA
jgi:hypothetical protein